MRILSTPSVAGRDVAPELVGRFIGLARSGVVLVAQVIPFPIREVKQLTRLTVWLIVLDEVRREKR